MARRTGVLGAAIIAVAILVVGVASAAAGSSGNDNRNRTIRVDAIVTELNLVHAGKTTPTLGDEIVFSQKLLRRGKQIGHAGAVCTTVSLEHNEAQCIATYMFSGGQITAQTLITLGSTAPYTVPITGGSGEYEGAEGEIQVSPVSATQGILTFDLD